MELAHVYHLYRRAAFGILPERARSLAALPKALVVKELLDASEKHTPLEMDLSAFEDFFSTNPNPKFRDFKKVLKENGDLKYDMNKAWLERLYDPFEELNERMTLFWANVFVCQDYVVPHALQFNNLLRKHALGNFKDFVVAVSKEPSMIKYLNTNKNKKDHPNENFARELMELFTLGVGNYSETDIKEAARAFTGYNYRLDGSFYIRERDHDPGEKEFMGWKANLDGDAIIAIISKQPACAEYICTKLYTYFVNEKPNIKHIDELVEVFYPDYEIRPVMEYLFASEWFYSDEHIGTKIKSPIDLLTSINKVVPFRFVKDKQHIYIQRITGQFLFYPPNVEGWKGGRDWINTNTLMVRLKLPSIFLGNGLVPREGFHFRDNGKSFGDRIKVQKKWSEFDKQYGKLPLTDLIDALCAAPLKEGTYRMLEQQEGLSKREFGLQLMSIPEFQLT